MKLVICLLAMVAVATAASVEKRSIENFGKMIECLGKLSAIEGLYMYGDYGCFCGKGSVGNTPIDATDRCCQTHDNCYGDAVLPDVGCTAFDTYTIDYDYAQTTDASGNCAIQCRREEEYDVTDERARCKAFMCECDLRGAQCFADERGTFSSKYRHFTFWNKSKCVTV